MKNILLLSAFLLLSLCINAQDENFPKQTLNTHTVSVGIQGGSPAIGYTQMLSERLSFGVDLGAFSSGVALNYFITNPRAHRVSIYTGLAGYMSYEGYPLYYLPVGISIDGKRKLNYKLDFGLKYSEYVVSAQSESSFGPGFGLKIGYSFGEDVDESKERETAEQKNIISLFTSGTDVMVGIAYERLLLPFLGVEAGIGVFGFSVGSKVYFPAIRPGHLNFHVGATYSNGSLSKALHDADGMLYFPVGLSYFANNNRRYSLDVGPKIFLGQGLYEIPGFSFGIGKAF